MKTTLSNKLLCWAIVLWCISTQLSAQPQTLTDSCIRFRVVSQQNMDFAYQWMDYNGGRYNRVPIIRPKSETHNYQLLTIEIQNNTHDSADILLRTNNWEMSKMHKKNYLYNWGTSGPGRSSSHNHFFFMKDSVDIFDYEAKTTILHVVKNDMLAAQSLKVLKFGERFTIHLSISSKLLEGEEYPYIQFILPVFHVPTPHNPLLFPDKKYLKDDIYVLFSTPPPSLIPKPKQIFTSSAYISFGEDRRELEDNEIHQFQMILSPVLKIIE